MNKRLVAAVGSVILLAGCGLSAEETRNADKQMYYNALGNVWAEQSESRRLEMCMSWNDNPDLLKLVFMVGGLDSEVYEETSLDSADVGGVIEDFFDGKCK